MKKAPMRRKRANGTSLLSAFLVSVNVTLQLPYRRAFRPAPAFFSRVGVQKGRSRLFSSVGDGKTPPPPGDGNGNSNNEWGDFLNPNESENLQRAREYLSENSLPISFDQSETENDEDDDDSSDKEGDAESSALVDQQRGGALMQIDPVSEEVLALNPYIAVVSKLTPSELISKFTSSAHPRVQNAVRNTILGLIGGLPKMAFDTTTITTGQRLASLMFQLQMTGYMFKNAEYRLSVQQSIGVNGQTSPGSDDDNLLLSGTEEMDEDEAGRDPLAGKVRGKLRIRYGGGSEQSEEASGNYTDSANVSSSRSPSLEMEVDAAAYMSELRSEVAQLRDELTVTRMEKEEALRKDLLLYIRTLPKQELQGLTNTMSQEVLVAMKGLVNTIMTGIGEGQIGPDTVTEQSGEAMAQLCMWQLVIGYNLRTLEVREEMKKSLAAGVNQSSTTEVGSIDLSDPDAMQ